MVFGLLLWLIVVVAVFPFDCARKADGVVACDIDRDALPVRMGKGGEYIYSLFFSGPPTVLVYVSTARDFLVHGGSRAKSLREVELPPIM